MSETHRHQRMTELFLAASELDENQRSMFLDAHCEGDIALRDEIETMLASEKDPSSFLDHPIVEYDKAVPPSLLSGVSAATPTSDGTEPLGRGRAGIPSVMSDDMMGHFPRIDGYTISGVLGQGGMGIVYRALQINLNRVVALKVLPAIYARANPEGVARFRREATAAARLHHTNIVAIHDFGESRDGYFYAMDLIEGQPLNVLLKRFEEAHLPSAGPGRLTELLNTKTQPVSTRAEARGEGQPSSGSTDGGSSTSSSRGRVYYRQVALWMADIADALHYAHGEGIVHRDIKPGNLILSTDGRIMITDFGLAKSSAEESVTVTGALLGTVRYLSPEQAMAKRIPIDHRTDIYSLGATMYELLCLRPAFPGVDDKQILAAIIARDPTPPRKILHAVPPELDTICLKSLEKSPDSRYATAAAMADDLRRYLKDLPIVAKRPGPLRRSLKFVRRHKAIVAAVVTAMLLIAATGFWFREQVVRREAEQRSLVARIDALFERGKSAVMDRNWDAAETAFEDVIHLSPNDVDAMLLMVWMKLEKFKHRPELATTAQLDQTMITCEQILRTAPNHPTALNYMGVLLKKLSRYDEAIAVTRKLIDQQPENFAAWSNLGAYYALVGDLKTAENCLVRGADLAQNSEEARSIDRAAIWRNLASLQLLLRQPSAVLSISNAITGNADDFASWLLRARMRLHLEGFADMEEALDDAKRVDRQPGVQNAKAKRILANAYLRMGRYEQAISSASAAIQLGDMPTINYLIIAISRAAQEDITEARLNLARARTLWPTELQERAFVASFDEGVLWFESADEMRHLEHEAEALVKSN